MNNRTLLATGITGTVIAAICCFTSVLVILLAAIGLSAWLAWLDFVLFPLLALFVGLTAFALFRWMRSRSGEASSSLAK